MKLGKFVLLPISNETRGHGTHSWPALYKEHLKDLLDRSQPPQPQQEQPQS